MPLRMYENPETGETTESLKPLPSPWVEVLSAPNSKFTETTNAHKGKSRIKGLNQTLKRRAREHAREHDLDDNIALNIMNGRESHVRRSMLNTSGKRKTSFDDL